MTEAGIWTVIYVAAAIAFGILMPNWTTDPNAQKEFFAGWLTEYALSVDNIFVFLMLFSYFAVPPQYQKRALIIGIIGAIVLRTVLILAGAWLLATFHWLLYVFGAFLVITGVKMWFAAGQEPDIATNPVLKLLKKRIRITDHFDGEKLSTMVNGVKHYTPLFAVLVLIGTTDVIFAVDSIPAIFAVTTDPFIVFTSNIFAVMGLRALYFLLADMAERFHLLKYGLALVLIYIGGKMLAMPWFHMPVQWSLSIVGAIILISVVLSLKFSGHRPPRSVS